MARFTDVFEDVTKSGKKIATSDYREKGLHPIIDQGQAEIAGYTNESDGLFTDIPAIIFGDHTRVIKYVDTPCFLGADGVKLLRAKIPNPNYRYLYYALSYADIPNTGYNRHFKWLKEVDIKLPDLKEQQKVVESLSKIDELIALRKEQLAALDQLFKSRFIELFGDPVQNEKNWPIATLGEVAEIRIGPFGTLLHKEDYIAGGHALVNPSHIVDGVIRIDEKLTVSDEKYKELSAYHLSVGDVVLGRRGEMGRCAVVHDEGLLCGTGSMIISPNKKMKPYFLQNIISSPAYKRIIEDKAVGVTMMNLNVPIVSSLTIPLLPVDMQEQFIAFMEQTDKSKSAIQRSLDELETLKKALMQKYFG